MTGPHQGLSAAPEVMWKIDRLTGLPFWSNWGAYQTWRGNRRGSPLRPCVKTISRTWPSKCASRIGTGHIPWETFNDGRQLIVTILGLSERRRVTKSEAVKYDSRKLTFLRGKENCRNINELGFGWRWSRDHVDVITSWAYDRNAFRAMSRPILKYQHQGHHKFIYNKINWRWRCVLLNNTKHSDIGCTTSR